MHKLYAIYCDNNICSSYRSDLPDKSKLKLYYNMFSHIPVQVAVPVLQVSYSDLQVSAHTSR